MSFIAALYSEGDQATPAEVSKPEHHVSNTNDDHHDTAKSITTAHKRVGYGLSSPSPRGVETWGPCSPFVLPDPSTQISLIEPEEISLILDGHMNGSNPNVGFDKDNKELVLPKNGFMELESMLESTELSVECPENENSNPADMKMDELDIMGSEENDKFIQDLFLQLKTENVPDNGVYPEPCVVKGEVKSPNVFLDMIQNQGARAKTSSTGKELDKFEGSSFCTQGVHKVETYSSEAIDTRNTYTGIVQRENSPDGYLGQRQDISFPDHRLGEHSGCAGRSKDKLSNITKSSLEQLSEEELKRIRRVKNRASVEKCRTKQRLRMEALQTELKALTSENKTLRDLTTWMDTSVTVISSQIAETAPSREVPRNQSSTWMTPVDEQPRDHEKKASLQQ